MPGAALVDQWREIEFFADDLESELDLVFEAEIGNNGNSPFSLRTANGQVRGGFRFDAPIVRLGGRNNYRQALISYQQARRSYYQFEDEIHANLRQILRELDLNKILFELNRQNVQVAIEQVELAQLSLEDPSSTSLGATTARDLTQAINSLQNAQSQFLAVWVDFEVLRRSLDFDLGTFQFGPDLSWIDPEVIDESIAARAAAMLCINLDDECYCQIDPWFDSQGVEMVEVLEESETENSEAINQDLSLVEADASIENVESSPMLPIDPIKPMLDNADSRIDEANSRANYFRKTRSSWHFNSRIANATQALGHHPFWATTL